MTRFAFAPLEALLRVQLRPELNSGQEAGVVPRMARVLEVSPRTIYRLRDDGLSEVQADRFAVRAGLHPAEVWEAWSTNPATERKRRQRADPAFRAREREREARYRAECAEYRRRKAAEHYRANRESRLAQQAEYDRTVRAPRRARKAA